MIRIGSLKIIVIPKPPEILDHFKRAMTTGKPMKL